MKNKTCAVCGKEGDEKNNLHPVTRRDSNGDVKTKFYHQACFELEIESARLPGKDTI